MITPRNFVCDTCSVFVQHKVMSTVIVFIYNMMTSALFTLTDNLLALNHIYVYLKFVINCTYCIHNVPSRVTKCMLVSST